MNDHKNLRTTAKDPTVIPLDAPLEICADSERKGTVPTIGGSASKRRKAEKGGRAWGKNQANSMHAKAVDAIDAKTQRSASRRDAYRAKRSA